MSVVKSKQAGFTLVELLVAVVILAIGLLGLAQLQVTAIKANSQSATITAANAIAQKIVEEIAAMPADRPIFDAPGAGTWPDTPLVTVAGAGTYAVTYVITQMEAGGSVVSNVMQIEIKVESTTDVAHVISNDKRSVTAYTIKRAI